MKASVIIPAYNAEKHLPACLQALQSQTIDRSLYEVIVVDDGSTDRTALVCGDFPGVRVLSQANQGPAAARNNGAKTAQADIVLFTDSDCEPFPDWIEQMISPFLRDADVVGVKGAYRTRQAGVTSAELRLSTARIPPTSISYSSTFTSPSWAT